MRTPTTQMPSLIRETLVHLDGIGPGTELKLWRAGISDWADLRSTKFARRAHLARALEASEDALTRGDLAFFFQRLPVTDRWRLFYDFADSFVGVDIETTGLSVYDVITLIGVETEAGYRTFIRGANLEEAVPILEAAAALITFNGTLFDLPFIRRTFPGIHLPAPHLDLRFLGRRVGLRGPLKTVERLAGFARSDELSALGGFAATVLWSEFAHERNVAALELLIKYNAADTAVLKPMCQLIVNRLSEHLRESLIQAERDGDHTQGELFDEPVAIANTAPDVPRPLIPMVRLQESAFVVGAITVPVPAQQQEGPRFKLRDLLGRMTSPSARIVGIDLSGSEKRPTGWALLQGDIVTTRTVSATQEIIDMTLACRPDLVSIDSPLALPAGRHCSLDSCDCRQFGISRTCERELRRRGISVYWCLVPSMQSLTRRGIEIATRLRSAGIQVIESYPGAAQDIMRIPRKRASLTQLRAGLLSFGLKGIRPSETVTHDELDAVTSAVVGTFYLAGAFEGLGDASEGKLIIPQPFDQPNSPAARIPTKACLFAFVGDGAQGFATKAGMAAGLDVEDWGTLGFRPSAPKRSFVVVAPDHDAFLSVLATMGPSVRCIVLRGDAYDRLPAFGDLMLKPDEADAAMQFARWTAEFD